MSDKPISPLRQRMIDDMTARRFKEEGQKDYVRHVRTFTEFLGRSPDTATSEDLRRFQLHMAQQQIGALDDQRRHRRAAVLLHRDARKARPRSPSEDRDRAAQGAGRAEPGGGGASPPGRAGPQVQGRAQRRLRRGPPGVRGRQPEGVRHRQSERMMLRVEQGKGQRDRDVMLSPQLLQLLREWWKAARPQVWLFPGQNPINPVTRASAQPRRHRRQRPGWNLQARFAPYPAAQLRDPSARTGRRHSRDPGVARNRHILPANNQSRDGSTIRFILGAARRCSSSGNSRIAGPIWSSFLSQTER